MVKGKYLVVGIALALILATGMVYAHGPDGVHEKQTKTVRDATEKYKNATVAEQDGYIDTGECVPHMGIHFVRSDSFPGSVDDEVEPRNPEVLVYNVNTTTDELELVAVEYFSTDPDEELFGHTFSPAPFPGVYELHAWVWKDNPDGMFASFNPNVTEEDCGDYPIAGH